MKTLALMMLLAFAEEAATADAAAADDDKTCVAPTCKEFSDVKCETEVDPPTAASKKVLDEVIKEYTKKLAKIGKCDREEKFTCKEGVLTETYYKDEECKTVDADKPAKIELDFTKCKEIRESKPAAYMKCGGVSLMSSLIVAAFSMSAAAFN